MRAKGMQVLTNNIRAKRPGTTIWGIGDEAHKLVVSGHNEDDTAGVRAEDQDPDSVPEHRAIDVKLDSHFSRSDGRALVKDLTTKPENQKRLLYVIFEGKIRSRSRGWVERDYDGSNPHNHHVHVSGEADEDANESDWSLSEWGSGPSIPGDIDEDLVVDGKLGPKTIAKWQKIMGTTVDSKIDADDSELVRAVQTKLQHTVDHRLVVDGKGIYQNGKRYKTIGALQRYLGSPVDQVMSVPVSQVVKALQRRLNEDRF